MLFSLRWLLLYQCLRPEAFARFVSGFSMPIAWPAVADGVAQGTTPNIAFSNRFPMTVATWLLMVVAMIVWNLGMVFFAYGIIAGHRYAFCNRVCGINFADFAGLRHKGGRQGWLGAVRGGLMAKLPKAKPGLSGGLP